MWNSTGKTLGLCLKTLFDLTDDFIPNMVSFMEMQRLLGVDQVSFGQKLFLTSYFIKA